MAAGASEIDSFLYKRSSLDVFQLWIDLRSILDRFFKAESISKKVEPHGWRRWSREALFNNFLGYGPPLLVWADQRRVRSSESKLLCFS